MPAPVAFTYDGADTITATMTDAVPGETYRIGAKNYAVTDDVVASGASLVLTLDISGAGLSAGDTFDGSVNHVELTAFDYMGGTTFVYGTPGELTFAAVWSYHPAANGGDGSVSVTFTGELGVNYELDFFDFDGLGFGDPTVGTGAEQTLTTAGFGPQTSDYFEAALTNLDTGLYVAVRMFAAGVASAGFAGTPGGDSPSPPPPPAVVVKLYDLATTLLADITPICLEKALQRPHNKARGFTVTAPAGHALLTTAADDGYPNLRKGNRKLIVWEDGHPEQPIFHGRIHGVERNGNGDENLVTITAWDPRMEFGYDSDDRAGRPVRDETGNFIDPSFSGTGTGGPGVISGPDLIFQVLTNSQGTDAEGGTHPGEGPLPLDLATGTFDLDVPPALDLSVVDTMDWPVLVGDFIAQLVQTGVVDIDVRPVDPSEGFDPYVMGVLSAVSSQGSDKSGTVHFDYFTGDHNAGACRHVEDFGPVCNKLYDYLGPRKDSEHWRANIVPGAPGTTIDPSASRALYGGPGADKGEFMAIRVFDSVGDEASSRPLYIALWNAEQGYRVEPRDLLFVTPVVAPKALFDAPWDFDVGDKVAINTGAAFGVALAETQRVLGYTKTWNREDVAQLSQLVTSADVSLGG